MLPNDYKPRTTRPVSEVINPGHFINEGRWYEDLKRYENNLDEMASATLDQNFKEEMQHVDQWYRYLTEAEKTATMYTLLQHSSQVQARFFINLLQQMVKRDPLYSLLTPTDTEHPIANAVAKAELEASQRLMSVLPYKTGVQQARHSFALGDTDDRLFGYSLLDDPSRRLSSNSSRGPLFNNGSRPHSVIEGDNSLFVPSTWNRRPNGVGPIGTERPKSADISHWNLPGQYSVWSQLPEVMTETNNSDFMNTYRRRMNPPRTNIPAVPETVEDLVRSSQDLFISKEGYTSDEGRRKSTSSKETVNNTKKHSDVVDMELLADVPAWLRSLRLHKYNPIFCDMRWQDMVKMSDQELLNKGVAALGARRKMLKVFENVKAHCEVNNIEY
ncbi:hypothetical protein G6F43_009471 [Rhizopus delemar]|nr:hypothetical protein G6F43_009471 [Rhizopus delemar]